MISLRALAIRCYLVLALLWLSGCQAQPTPAPPPPAVPTPVVRPLPVLPTVRPPTPTVTPPLRVPTPPPLDPTPTGLALDPRFGIAEGFRNPTVMADIGAGWERVVLSRSEEHTSELQSRGH